MTSLGSSPGSDSSHGIFTPAGSVSPLPPSSHSPTRQDRSIKLVPLPSHKKTKKSLRIQNTTQEETYHDGEEEDIGFTSDASSMSNRPPMHRPTSGLPLLDDKTRAPRGRSEDNTSPLVGSHRPPFSSRRDTFRSRSPKLQKPQDHTRKKYIYATFFLLLSLVSFVVQTETAVYIQHELKWNKAYCMLWLTHGSWAVLWPVQLLILRIRSPRTPLPAFWASHKRVLDSTALMVQTQSLNPSKTSAELTYSQGPWRYLMKTVAFITTFLTMAGGSWYVAVNLTTPSDLTAIYNCSAFFAYIFSILLLKEKARLDKIVSVALAILGVLVVAYGDTGSPKHGSHSGGATNPNHDDEETQNRAVGNLVIGIGSVLYGLYEVLYKKYACPPEGCSPNRGMMFAITFGSMIGVFTICVLWIPIPILHYFDIERFELPTGQAAALLAVSTLSNAVFSGSFLILMSLTSPVLSSVAALLTIFLVAITDYLVTGEPLSAATISGGLIIIVAFGLLSWATYREMQDEERKRVADEDKNFDENEAMLDDEGLLSEDEEFDQTDLGRGSKRRESR